MAKTKISEYDSTANNNTDVASVNIDEGCAPSGINNAIRAVMAHLKDFQQGTNGDSFNGPVNGTVGATTPAAGTFTTLATTGNTTLGNDSGDVITINGSTAFGAGAGITGNLTLSSGTANGVAYLNGSKVLTSGSALTFDGTNLATTGDILLNNARYYYGKTSGGTNVRLLGINSGNSLYVGIDSGPSDMILNASSSSSNIQFLASGSEQMRLTSTGLGIGTSSPSAKLHILNTAAVVTEMRAGNSASYASLLVDGTGASQLHAPGGTQIFNVNGSERARIDSSGNVGIGTSSPDTGVHLRVYGNAYYTAQYGTGNKGRFGADATGAFIDAVGATPLVFQTNTTERARIDSSGNLLVGTTGAVGSSLITSRTTTGGKFPLAMNGQDRGVLCRLIGSEGYAAYFERNNGTYTGDIYITSSSTTLYTSASDYRLKENIQPMTGALDKVAALKPCTYDWKADGSVGEGFIAHEVQQIIPQAVRGEKDAVDADGNPVYQGIDTSFLVATLTAAIQELKAEFDAYKASHP